MVQFLLFVIFSTLWAQYPTFQNCPNLTENNFSKEALVTKVNNPDLEQVLKFDFFVDSESNVNLYLIERKGSIKYFDAKTGIVSMVTGNTSGVDELDVRLQGEYGLVGMALDPNFSTNRWIYLHYLSASNNNTMMVSRFTLTTNNKFDVTSEKVLLQWTVRVTSHTGGDMVFDDMGNLIFTAGESHLVGGCYEPRCYHDPTDLTRTVENGPSNTNDYRGSVIRIHPEDDGTYSIPKGNFAEFYSDYYTNLGDGATAAEYSDPNKVRPELYAKGLRNPYTLTHDSKTNWLTIGDCGSECRNYNGYDANRHYCPPGALGEEHNLLTQPTNMGWPYFHGDNYPYAYIGEEQNPLSPMNTSPVNTGVHKLPPATAATYSYPQSCSMTGPIYRYDPQNTSQGKLPPHFDGSWFTMDFVLGWIKLIQVDSEGKFVSISNDIFTDLKFESPLKMKIGPDGMVYVINHNCAVYNHGLHDQCTGIYRISYDGPGCSVGIGEPSEIEKGKEFIKNTAHGILINVPEPSIVNFYNSKGSILLSESVFNQSLVPHQLINHHGLIIVEMKTGNNKISRRIFIPGY